MGDFGGAGLFGWIMPIFGMLIGIAFLAAIIIGIVMLAKSASRTGGTSATRQDGKPGEPPAQRLLDERYARGEIEREEYLQRKSDLAS